MCESECLHAVAGLMQLQAREFLQVATQREVTVGVNRDGVPVIHLLPALSARSDRDALTNQHDFHLTPLGYAVVAQELADALMQRRSLPQRAHSPPRKAANSAGKSVHSLQEFGSAHGLIPLPVGSPTMTLSAAGTTSKVAGVSSTGSPSACTGNGRSPCPTDTRAQGVRTMCIWPRVHCAHLRATRCA